MKRILFICGQNRIRSPTAEKTFSSYPGIEVASAGINHDAEEPLTPEWIEWADLIFVMEKSHRTKLSKKFRVHLKNKQVICLDIPDEYAYNGLQPDVANAARLKPERSAGAESFEKC